jgi:hypothetical protein
MALSAALSHFERTIRHFPPQDDYKPSLCGGTLQGQITNDGMGY